VTTTKSDAGVKFTHSAKARRQAEPEALAAARGVVLRLAARRSLAWQRRRPSEARALTLVLDGAWNELRCAQALVSPYQPPRRKVADYTLRDLRYRNGEYALDRFLLDRVSDAAGAVVELSRFASELAAYVHDPDERRDLPSTRELARQLRDRGISTLRRGGQIWVEGVVIVAEQDESAHSPSADSC